MMKLGRLESYILLSLSLHVLLLFLVPWLSPKPVKSPPIFEVAWVDLSATEPSHTKAVHKNTPKQKKKAAPARFQAPKAKVRAAKPSLDLSSKPVGVSGGGLSLGGSELGSLDPSPSRKGSVPLVDPALGFAAKSKPGLPSSLTSRQINQSHRNQGGGPLVGKVQAEARVDQQGRNTQAGHQNSTGVIEGEVSGRPVIYSPKAPALDMERDITVTLRFMVLSNGAVEQIIPIKKADARLEALAIDLLSRYRFRPIAGAKPQSGVIHFILRRGQR